MISIYTKSGSIQGKHAISFILKSQKHKWVKAHKYNKDLPENQFTRKIALDAISILYALKHVRDKYRKKKVIIHNDSEHIASALQKKNGVYVKKTNIEILDKLRDAAGSFSNLHIKEFSPKCEYHQELEHILTECALDEIEIDEKD